jgi:hypothetical protein
MSLEGQARPEKRQKSPPTLVEVSVALVAVLLLVLTGIRLVGGFDVSAQRGAQAAMANDRAPDAPLVVRTSRPGN